MDCTEHFFIQVSWGTAFGYNTEECTEDCFIQVGGTVFRYTLVDSTEDCFLQVGVGEKSSSLLRFNELKAVFNSLVGEQSSYILQWTVLKTVLNRLVGEQYSPTL